MNRLIVLGIAALVALYVLYSSIYVVNEREQAIITRFGQITDVKTDPGIYFKIPTTFVDNVQTIEDRLLRFNISNMQVQVKDGKFYIVDAFATYRISDPRAFRTSAQGELRQVEDQLATRFDSALRSVYGLRDFTAALSEQRTVMMAEARDKLRPELAPLGVEVVDVRILRTDLDPNVSQQTFERMKAERQAEAARLRARGQEAKLTAQAIADRQVTEILSAAQRDSEILRGEGEAQRSQIFAEAFGRDPGFFEFYRSMQSYRAALGGAATTMVLSPDSEFFRYFGNENPDNSPPPSPDAASGLPAASLIEDPAETSPLLEDTGVPGAATDVAPTAPDAAPAPAAQ